MGDRKIIYIPKEYHGQADKLKGKQLKVLADDDLFGDGPVTTEPEEPQLDMKQVKKTAKEVAEQVGGTYRGLPKRRG